MKKLHYILLIAVALLVSNCDTNDDGFYNNIFVDIPNLVAIEPHASTYAVGEKLYIEADFSRYLSDGALLDIYKTTGATQFAFSYVIEKQTNATTWEVVTVNDSQLDIVKGTAQNGSYVYGICEYNATDETYEYRVGFPLLSSGTYRMSFGYNSDSLTKVELRSLSPATRLILNINSLISGLNSGGYYNFTVN
ncbi:hypothetical protein QWY90_07180 [Flavobacterium paronense]|uniref:DUF5017 domain-containing protein n=1 Tax=Flavobacterium paronense TaxID=1392775 RepID=A0ABV5GHF9_9FLAO|nr:hypothetical protein [Flavobacterium paronense]MDN3677092.1 hypothetical protein [Flavobacterium paronense]